MEITTASEITVKTFLGYMEPLELGYHAQKKEEETLLLRMAGTTMVWFMTLSLKNSTCFSFDIDVVNNRYKKL